MYPVQQTDLNSLKLCNTIQTTYVIALWYRLEHSPHLNKYIKNTGTNFRGNGLPKSISLGAMRYFGSP